MKPQQSTASGDTDELPATGALNVSTWGPGGVPVKAHFAAMSHQGRVRPVNEDHYLVLRFGRVLEPLLSNLPADWATGFFQEGGYALAVADGMGGASGGAVASALAIRTFLKLVCETPDWVFGDDDSSVTRVADRFTERFRETDAALREHAADRPELAGMGTTLTLACSFGERMLVAHVGDSRAYVLRGGKLHQVTRDHTLAQEMKNLGFIRSVDDAASHLRHILSRTLGGGSALDKTDVHRVLLADGDRLLLCSDGLHGMIDAAAITRLLGTGSSQQACSSLIDAALDAGGKDNVTVVVADYHFEAPLPRG